MEEPILRKDQETGLLAHKNTSHPDHSVQMRNSLVFRAKITFFFLGLINHCGFTIVLSASQDLAKKFGHDKLMSLFSGFLVLFSIGVKIFNAKFLLKIYHKVRIAIAVSLFLSGVTCIILALRNETFVLALIGSTLLGMGGAFGEANIQGFIKGFPPETIGAFSSGTGGAGLFGSFYYFMFKVYGYKESGIFAYLYPPYLLYFFLFAYVVHLKVRYDECQEVLIEDKEGTEGQEAHINTKLSFSIIPSILKKIYQYTLYFGAVYFFEYSSFGYLASITSKKLKDESFLAKNAYLIILMIYQFGVFLARSSLQLLKIRWLSLLCSIQGSFFLLWICFAIFITPSIYFMFSTIFVIGIVAGLTYVNTVYMILNDPNIPKGEKEVCLNVNIMFSDTGVLLNSLSGVLFNHFFG